MLIEIFDFSILRKRKQEQERREQYVKMMSKTKVHFNGVRVNEELVGKILSAKSDEVITESSYKVPVQSSVDRPMSFGNNVFAWLDYIRQEAKDIMNKNHSYEKNEKDTEHKAALENDTKILTQRRKFFQDFGVLPKQMA